MSKTKVKLKSLGVFLSSMDPLHGAELASTIANSMHNRKTSLDAKISKTERSAMALARNRSMDPNQREEALGRMNARLDSLLAREVEFQPIMDFCAEFWETVWNDGVTDPDKYQVWAPFTPGTGLKDETVETSALTDIQARIEARKQARIAAKQ